MLQSGQPYSVIDFSGAIGSIYYSTSDGITNPIVPLAPGCTAKNALDRALRRLHRRNAGLHRAEGQLLHPAAARRRAPIRRRIPSTDPYETGFTTGQRNIFRQSFQKRADASLVKITSFTERYTLKYTFDVYNLTNTTSFDVPGNEVSQNQNYNSFPAYPDSGPGTPTGALPSSPCAVGNDSNTGFYNCPFGLGFVTHTIGSQRQIQMSLGLTF